MFLEGLDELRSSGKPASKEGFAREARNSENERRGDGGKDRTHKRHMILIVFVCDLAHRSRDITNCKTVVEGTCFAKELDESSIEPQ